MTTRTAASTADVPVRFEILHRHGIWTVTKDFAFFGDFTRELFALEAVETALTDLANAGGTAHVITKVA